MHALITLQELLYFHSLFPGLLCVLHRTVPCQAGGTEGRFCDLSWKGRTAQLRFQNNSKIQLSVLRHLVLLFTAEVQNVKF